MRFTDNGATGPTEIYLGADRSYPQGWKVQMSDPAATWSSSYDEATQVLSVTTDRTGGAHAICVTPADAPDGCTATDPVVETTTTTTAPAAPAPGRSPAPTAGGARPVRGRPAYTG